MQFWRISWISYKTGLTIRHEKGSNSNTLLQFGDTIHYFFDSPKFSLIQKWFEMIQFQILNTQKLGSQHLFGAWTTVRTVLHILLKVRGASTFRSMCRTNVGKVFISKEVQKMFQIYGILDSILSTRLKKLQDHWLDQLHKRFTIWSKFISCFGPVYLDLTKQNKLRYLTASDIVRYFSYLNIKMLWICRFFIGFFAELWCKDSRRNLTELLEETNNL